jgi:3-hydroxyisobutyrate dehydrogenase-like beta-hydroxyacid dehydrogenase
LEDRLALTIAEIGLGQVGRGIARNFDAAGVLASQLLDRAVATGRVDDDFTTLHRLFEEPVSGSDLPKPEAGR